LLLQDSVPLSQFDAWSKCKVPGVKANLTAVKLTDAQKAGAITNGLPVEVPAPAPVVAPVVEAPAPAVAAPTPSQAQPEVAAPAPAPAGGAATLSKAVAAGAALLGALLLAL
jgi:hypothetical protein